ALRIHLLHPVHQVLGCITRGEPSSILRTQFLFQLLPRRQQPIHFLRHLPGEAEIGGHALHAARAGVEAQEVQADRLQRRDGIREALLHEVALAAQLLDQPVAALGEYAVAGLPPAEIRRTAHSYREGRVPYSNARSSRPRSSSSWNPRATSSGPNPPLAMRRAS